MLGNDTLSAESFVRTGDRVDGMIVRRIPRTVVVRYVMTLAPTGLPARLEYNTRLPDGSMPPNVARTVIVTFTGDSAFTEIVRDSTTRRRVAVRNALPAIDGAVSFYALPVAALRAMNADSARFATYGAGTAAGEPTPVARRAANTYWLYSFGNPVEVVTDAAGRLLSVDGSRTTERILAHRRAAVDVPAVAAAFVARERALGPITALSPRDSAAASIGGVRLSVDYGRPAARGRRIWGPNGVLGDTLWRTGANASTKLTIAAPITIGGRALPAGTYSLMTLAIPGRYQLVLYEGDAELMRVPLQATPIDPPIERFTIVIDPAGERAGTLRLRWDTLELSVPISIGS
jgi:hypothetical protein